MSVPVDRLTEQLHGYIGDIDPSSRKGRRRLAIIEAATARFKAEGYRATSMDDIAADVGVAKGTLYLYFPKKIDLLIACSAREKLEWIPRFTAVFDPSTGSAAVRLKRWLTLLLTLPGESLTMRLLEDGVDEILAEMPPELVAQGNANIAEYIAPMLDEVAGHHRWSLVELVDRANVLRALAHLGPVLRHEHNHPGMSTQRFAAILADLVVDGLRPRPPGDVPADVNEPPISKSVPSSVSADEDSTESGEAP